jgi:hypothetical protein
MFLTVASLGVVVWQFGWWAPPAYAPSDATVLVGEPLGGTGHDERVVMLGKGVPYVLHVEPGAGAGPDGGAPVESGALVYFGSVHSKDPDHPMHAELRRVWEEFEPTVALVEGRMGFFVGLKDQGIGVFGEGAAVYAMAEDAGIPIYTLEPPVEVEIAALREIGSAERVAMFRVLSGYISARRGGPVSEFKVSRLLAKRAAPLTDALPDAAALDAMFAAEFPEMGPWREIPEESLWPGRTDTWMNLMATRGNAVRDPHFVKTMVELVHRGERVLAIAGRSHVVVWEPVVMETLGATGYGALSSPRPWGE